MFRPVLAAAMTLALAAGAVGLANSQPSPPPGPSKDPAAAPAGDYVLDKMHASVIAHAKHLGLSNFAMRFNTVDASFSYDPKNPAATKVTASVDATSVDVGPQMYHDAQSGEDMTLNQHFVKQRDIAGGSKTPVATFVSKSINPGADGKGTMTGDLTLNGVTKPVTFNVVYSGSMAMGPAQRMGFSATTTIKRSDFGVASYLPAFAVGDDVALNVEVEFVKQ